MLHKWKTLIVLEAGCCIYENSLYCLHTFSVNLRFKSKFKIYFKVKLKSWLKNKEQINIGKKTELLR